AVRAMGAEVRIAGQPLRTRAKLEVELGVLGRRCHDRERLHAERFQLRFVRANLRDLASAEGAPEPDQEREEHGAPSSIVCQGYRRLAVDGGKSELGRGLAW